MRAMSRSIGFSHRTFLPARTDARMRSVWVAVAEAISTASTLASSMASPGSGLQLAPYLPARVLAAASTGSQTQASSASPLSTIERA